MIAQLDYRIGSTFSGVFRIHQPEIKIARNSTKYLSCKLSDRSGELPAVAWLDRYVGEVEFNNMEKINAQCRLRFIGERWIADLAHATRLTENISNPLELVPQKACPFPASLARLECLVGRIRNTALRKMLDSIMNNDSIFLPFIFLPASRKNHHAYPGGLLEHSLECAEFVDNYKTTSDDIRELGIVAALLHDIGKIRTISADGGGTMIGRILGHDLLTLELLAEPLSLVDKEWQDGGTALRYLLSWKLQVRNKTTPLMVITELIQAADRISSGNDNEKVLFRDMPAWRQYAYDDNGRRAWRPKKASNA